MTKLVYVWFKSLKQLKQLKVPYNSSKVLSNGTNVNNNVWFWLSVLTLN